LTSADLDDLIAIKIISKIEIRKEGTISRNTGYTMGND
jgi:hypothetical protein